MDVAEELRRRGDIERRLDEHLQISPDNAILNYIKHGNKESASIIIITGEVTTTVRHPSSPAPQIILSS